MGGQIKAPPISSMTKGFLIVVCIIIVIALIVFPLLVSYKALKKAKSEINKAVKNKLFCGSVNAVKIKATIIKSWDKKSQLFL